MTGQPTDRPDEAGLSLVEVVVSMVFLMVVALAFLPLAARASTAAATGTTLTTATRLVSKQLEAVRTEPQLPCEVAGPAPAWQLLATTTDARGVQLKTYSKLGQACTPQGGPVVYTVSVSRTSDPDVPVARAATVLTVPAW